VIPAVAGLTKMVMDALKADQGKTQDALSAVLAELKPRTSKRSNRALALEQALRGNDSAALLARVGALRAEIRAPGYSAQASARGDGIERIGSRSRACG